MQVLILYILLPCVGRSAAAGSADADPDCNQVPACAQTAKLAWQSFSAADYQQSVRRYQSAFSLVADPRLLVNIGRCYFRTGEAAQALVYYNQALALARERETLREATDYREEALQLLQSQHAARASVVPAPGDAAKSLSVAPVPVKRPRTLWQLTLGPLLLGAAGTLGGFGIAGALLDQQAEGKLQYDTSLPSIVLIASAGTALLAGSLLLALPGPKRTPPTQQLLER